MCRGPLWTNKRKHTTMKYLLKTTAMEIGLYPLMQLKKQLKSSIHFKDSENSLKTGCCRYAEVNMQFMLMP